MRVIPRQDAASELRGFVGRARQLGIAPAPGSGAERAMVALQRLKARLSHG